MQNGSVRAYYKRNAKQRGIPFNLTLDEVTSLISQNCHYCGAGLSNLIKARIDRARHTNFAYNGIDRKDNTKPYEFSNCVPCCRRCNYAKGPGLSYELMLFLGQALRIWDATSEERRPQLAELLRDLEESGPEPKAPRPKY